MTRRRKNRLKRTVAATLAATTLTMSLGTIAKAGSNVVVVQNGVGKSYVMQDYRMPRGFRTTRDLRALMMPLFPDLATRAPHAMPLHAPMPRYGLQLDCVVAGTPVEFPNDIRISNPYRFALDAGTIGYSAPGGHSGTVNVATLGPGQGFYVSNAVPGGMTAGAPCSASTQ